MKKVLFTALAIAVAMSGFAQKGLERVKAEKLRSAKAQPTAMGKNFEEAPAFNFAPATSVPTNLRGEDVGGWQTMLTFYDLQTNKLMGNRMYRFDDGTVGLTATWAQNTPNFTDRGTGYDYHNGTKFIFEEDSPDGLPAVGLLHPRKQGRR